ncbi:carbohydrate kinase [Streptomyces sp. NPDC050504]|uniref:carbohydrate kinase n=1 Tax=Streptomyces sp. NPDC050504 TaxID=3365618 RepID=UPI0037A83DD3
MIVIAGEALIDLVPETASDALAPLRPARGGGPYNTAVALARLGGESAFCSRISTDEFGEALLAHLRAEGVDVTLVQRGPEPTPLAVAALDGAGSATYTFYTQGTADRLFTAPGALPPTTRALAVGTCSLVLEPGASAYEALLRREASRGTFTLLDPNVRPPLIEDPAAYRARFLTWLPHVTLLKLSEEDANWLEVDIATCLERGPEAVVLTRGARGLTVYTANGPEVSVPATPAKIADTIGAGDTVNAVLLHALSPLPPEERATLPPETWHALLTRAAEAAAITCSRPGAQPPYAHEL